MTKLWILSDLHLETLPYPENFRPAPPAFDVLVAAGDIQEGDPGRGFAVPRRTRTASIRPGVAPGMPETRPPISPP